MNTIKQLCFLSILFMHSIGAMHNTLIDQLNELNNTLAAIQNILSKTPSKKPSIEKYELFATWGEPLTSILDEVKNSIEKVAQEQGRFIPIAEIKNTQIGSWRDLSPEEAISIDNTFKSIFQREKPFIEITTLKHVKNPPIYEELSYEVNIRSKRLDSLALKTALITELNNRKLSKYINLSKKIKIFSKEPHDIPGLDLSSFAQKFNDLDQAIKTAEITLISAIKDGTEEVLWTTPILPKTKAGFVGWIKSWFKGSSESEATNIPPAPSLELYKQWEAKKKLKEAEEELKKEQDRIAREEEEARRIREEAIRLATLEEARLKLEAERLEEARKETELLKKLTESKEHKEIFTSESTSKWPLDYAEIQKAKVKLTQEVYDDLIKILKNIEKENVHTYIFKEGNKIKQVIFEGENKGSIEYETDADINFLLKPYLNHYRDRITTGVFIKEEPTKNIVIKNEALKQLLGL